MTELCKEYAAALFSLARENECEEACYEGLHLMLGEISPAPDYLVLLSSPSVPAAERVSLLETAFAGRVCEPVLSFASLLCERGHMMQFPHCVSEFDALYKALRSVLDARVVSAVALTEQEKAALVQKLEKISGRHVRPQYEVDPSLLGGVTVYMDGTVIDGSLRRKLNEMKDVIGK